MTAYYNEYDPKVAAWLRQLIKNGDIADGEVDERSITDVEASDLRGFTQHHFFAGVGTWSYALRNAGWSDDRPVCTASLPCQPFSAAGNQKGKEDERHLLPHFLELVKECGFNVIIGEQVESAIRHGWLDDLQTTMEAENYTVGHCVLGAHSVNAAHQRQRLYWVAEQVCVGDPLNTGLEGGLRGGTDPQRENIDGHAGRVRADSGVATSAGSGREQGVQPVSNSEPERTRCHSERGGMGDSEHDGHPSPEKPRGNEAPILSCAEGSNSTGELERASPPASLPSKPSGVGNSRGVSGSEEKVRCEDGHFNGDMSFGLADASEIEWIYCRDNKYRPIKSGSIEMASRVTRGMVCSCNTINPVTRGTKEGDINGTSNKTNTTEILQDLQYQDGEETTKQSSGGLSGVQEEKLLQPDVHGKRSGERGLHKPESQQNEGKQYDSGLLRGVWKNNHTTCASCGRESFQQLNMEFDDVVRSMPQGGTLETFFGAEGAKYLQSVRKAGNEEQPLLDAQYPLPEVWKSLNDEDKSRVSMAFNSRGWVVSEGVKPLVDGLARGVVYRGGPIDANATALARTVRLKGYGNAIQADTATAFISAYMEAEITLVSSPT